MEKKRFILLRCSFLWGLDDIIASNEIKKSNLLQRYIATSTGRQHAQPAISINVLLQKVADYYCSTPPNTIALRALRKDDGLLDGVGRLVTTFAVVAAVGASR
ncbi:hypothetical protein LSTR_LSTR009598 [Laodelphax striatellus]|uniref:Uncharacterized protein n=1 Tax=Laodelphax striatellus TaxID=195883 RepID=A0A482WRS3_LAOST|nr:hypothetical protein LSTR_LSTR009598 [Laodelphax striatellus]